MTNENQSKLERIVKTAGKIAAGAVLAGSLYMGSFHNTKGFFPFYTKVTGKTYGIAAGLYVKVDKNAELNGAVIGIASRNDGKINGVQVCGFNAYGSSSTVKGISAGALNSTTNEAYNSEIRGLQCGLINIANTAGEKSKVVQIGLVNAVEGANRAGIGFNSYFAEAK